MYIAGYLLNFSFNYSRIQTIICFCLCKGYSLAIICPYSSYILSSSMFIYVSISKTNMTSRISMITSSIIIQISENVLHLQRSLLLFPTFFDFLHFVQPTSPTWGALSELMFIFALRIVQAKLDYFRSTTMPGITMKFHKCYKTPK